MTEWFADTTIAGNPGPDEAAAWQAFRSCLPESAITAARSSWSTDSGQQAEPPSDDFIMRNSMDSQEVAVAWWPGDARYGKAAFYALEFVRSVFRHACAVCGWEPSLATSAEGEPPPVV